MTKGLSGACAWAGRYGCRKAGKEAGSGDRADMGGTGGNKMVWPTVESSCCGVEDSRVYPAVSFFFVMTHLVDYLVVFSVFSSVSKAKRVGSREFQR